MASKRAKSGTAAPVGRSWETELTAAVFDEESWRASVSVVVGENEMCVSALKQAVQQPLRRLFTLLSWESTLEKIHELGNPKAKKNKDVPVFYEVTELAKSALDAGEALSVDLTAKLVKFQLLAIKSSDLQQREALQRVAEEKVRILMGTGSSAREKSGPPAKGAAKGEKGKKTSEDPPPIKETKLKRRGEEDYTDKYIDDEPDDGPHHYVLITGFHQPCLISALDSLGVHVSNVIRLRSDRPERSDAPQELTAPDTPQPATEQQNGAALSGGEKQDLDVFWDQLNWVLNSGGVGSTLWDVARLDYRVEPSLLPPDPGSSVAMQALGMALFQGVACLLYDSLDWRRQHQHYLRCMRLIPVPVAGGAESLPHPQAPQTQTPQITKKKPVAKESPAEAQRTAVREPACLSTDVDMRLYRSLLDPLPVLVQSVALILHCMLEQVVTAEQEVLSGSNDSEQCSDWSEQELTSYMLSSVLSLPRSEEEKRKLMEDFGMREHNQMKSAERHPTLLYYHDHRARRLHQLPVWSGLDVFSIEAAMMEKTVLWDRLMSEHRDCTSTDLARRHQLLQTCSDDSLSCSTVQRLLQLYVFESMPLITTDANGHLIRPLPGSLTPLPWDDPVAYAQHLYRNLRRTQGSSRDVTGGEDQKVENDVSAAHLQKTLTRRLRDRHCTEHHSPAIFPQVLEKACEEYRCTDVLHSGVNNATFLICHNPMSSERCSRESWEGSVHTDVGFRWHFLEHVAMSYQEEQRQQQRGDSGTPRRLPSARTHTNPEAPVVWSGPEDAEPHVRQGSLKAWKQQVKEEELHKNTRKEGKGTPSAKGGDRGARENRKIQSKTPEFAKQPEGDLETPQENKPVLIGYNMDGRVVQVRGETQCLYPTDGGHISVDRVHFVQGSTQLRVCVKKDHHHFYTYVSQQQRQNSRDAQGQSGCFYGVLHSGIQLSYSGTPLTTETGPMETGAMETGAMETRATETRFIPPTHTQQADECGCGNSAPLRLHLSLPTGLQISFGFEETEGGQAVLVRQQAPPAGHGSSTALLSKHTELSRTITGLGTVIRHMRDGSTEVLFADGTVSGSPDSGPVCVLVPSSAAQEDRDTHTESKDRKGKVTSKSTTGTDLMEPLKEEHRRPLVVAGGSWTTTTPSGFRVASTGGGRREVSPVRTYRATDPFSQSVVITRDNRVLSVLEKDGTIAVDHADGTRMTTFYQQRDLPQHQSSAGGSTECRREKIVRVESGGLTTVTVNCDSRNCEVLFGDGTVVTASARGSYRVCPSGGGELHIGEDGLAVYCSNPGGLGPEGDQPGQYVMSHSAGVLCRFTDPDGNLYQVSADGQASIRTSRDTELERDTEKGTSSQDTHPPRSSRGARICGHGAVLVLSDRMFVMAQDGSGTELLSAQSVAELLNEAYSDPAVAVIRDPLPDTTDVVGITILQPFPADLSSHWLIPKQQDDIIPANLKSRKWDTFPVSGKHRRAQTGAVLGGEGARTRMGPDPQTPAALLARQISKHPPLTHQLHGKLQEKLLVYIEQLVQKERLKDEIELKEPRTVQERVQQSQLLQLLLSLPDSQRRPVTMETRPLSADVVSLYSQAMLAECPLTHPQEQDTSERFAPGPVVEVLANRNRDVCGRAGLRNTGWTSRSRGDVSTPYETTSSPHTSTQSCRRC
ncbi:sperm-associated antigen 17 isoform X2 [Electrophorus electricus]|uniref:sperm-associated antigen 17 isoform X2 n=1 Tax=Electrophorus electricus TaxID=8005 RepID=UPI0015D053C9|nr:sperm-associated antigen 17 isoform X2 [Electrophorus electricus]